MTKVHGLYQHKYTLTHTPYSQLCSQHTCLVKWQTTVMARGVGGHLHAEYQPGQTYSGVLAHHTVDFGVTATNLLCHPVKHLVPANCSTEKKISGGITTSGL